MIDSNETVSYENGIYAGYNEGYFDGVISFANYLKKNYFVCTFNESCFYKETNTKCVLKEYVLDDMVKDFLENQ